MNCEEKVREDLKEALRQHDGARVSILRLLLSEIKKAEIAERNPLDDDKILDVISKEAKRHRESIAAFKQGNRVDLVAQEEAELSILMAYLPKQMSREEIVAVAQETIGAVGAKAISDKGKVMSQVMPKPKGKADGKEGSDVVSELLTNL